MYRAGPVALLTLVLCLVMLAGNLMRGHPPGQIILLDGLIEGPLAGALLAGVAVLLELRAPRLEAFGFLSAASALVLAMALTPLGPAMAALTGCGALVARSLLRGRPELAGRLREFLADALPLLAAVSLVGAGFPPWAVLIAWLGLSVFFPGVLASELTADENLAWGQARSRLTWALPCLALLVVPLTRPGALWLLPALIAFQELLRPLSSGELVQKRERDSLERRLEESANRLDQLQYQLEHVHLVAVNKAQELRRLERVTRSLTRSEAVSSTAELVLDMVSQTTPRAESVVLFLVQEGRLWPLSSRTPHQTRLENASLLQLGEPCVEEAMRTGQPVYRTGQTNPSRLFEGESVGLAMPLDGYVLYVGSNDPEGFPEETRDLLAVVGAQTLVALQSARRRQAELEALEMHRAAHERLQGWVERLASLLEGTRLVAGTLELDEMALRVEQMAAQVVAHNWGILLARKPDGALAPLRFWGGTPDRAATVSLAETIRTNRRPLLLDDVTKSRFTPLVAGQRSLVGVPLLVESDCLGVLILTASEPGAFSREDQDLLFLIGFLSAVAYSNVRHHQDLKDAQSQLLQTSKLAAVGQLAAGVAHELNTPLAAIRLAAEGAQLKADRPDIVVKRLEKLRAATDQAQKIVSNLLIYCQGREAPTFQDANLNQVVEDTLGLLRYQLNQDRVELAVETSELPSVQGNPSQLQQVVTNLLINARDAVSGPGARSRRVRVRTWRGPSEVFLSVEDDGPGVPAEVVPHLFEPFFTTKPVGKGTGLGLSVSHQIVAQHGGRLEYADAGAGARFVVRLPIASAG
ncbi:MAG: hypothetical protein AMXMBFR33_11660 [Candidatus Xenobia bacterium]